MKRNCMIRRSNEIKNEYILHSIDAKQILMNLSHSKQATTLVIKYPLYDKLTLSNDNSQVRKYEKVIYRRFKRTREEDV